MKKISVSLSRIVFIVSSLLLLTPMMLYAEYRFTTNDPNPIYTAANPLGMYTFWRNCEPEHSARLSVSVFRQKADWGRGGPCDIGTGCADVPNACTDCCRVCSRDVPLGDIHGRWNMIGLLYDEANGNHTVRDNLVVGLGLLDPAQMTTCPPGITTPLTTILAKLALPSNTDPKELFGFFSVPIEYRKYGIRFQAEIEILCGFGLRFQTGVVTIQQRACFNDQTCSSKGSQCATLTDLQCNSTCQDICCVINDFNCDYKKFVINGIMDQLQKVVEPAVDTTIGNVQMLDLNIDNFCCTDIEDITLSLYWTHCFAVNQLSENPCWPEFTIAPFFVGEVSAPVSNRQNPNQLFSLPFGLNKHWGFGFTGGLTINFIETVEVGFDAGFTRFNDETYFAHPVPTHELQQGIFPRKANLCIQPGTVWSFGATLGAYHYLSCLSSYIQFRLLHKCEDHICVLSTIPWTQLAGEDDDDFPRSNVKVAKMERESEWTSSFVNVHFDYDISDNIALGFLWQAPLSQTFAYRPTTIMGSLIIQY